MLVNEIAFIERKGKHFCSWYSENPHHENVKYHHKEITSSVYNKVRTRLYCGLCYCGYIISFLKISAYFTYIR